MMLLTLRHRILIMTDSEIDLMSYLYAAGCVGEEMHLYGKHSKLFKIF